MNPIVPLIPPQRPRHRTSLYLAVNCESYPKVRRRLLSLRLLYNKILFICQIFLCSPFPNASIGDTKTQFFDTFKIFDQHFRILSRFPANILRLAVLLRKQSVDCLFSIRDRSQSRSFDAISEKNSRCPKRCSPSSATDAAYPFSAIYNSIARS